VKPSHLQGFQKWLVLGNARQTCHAYTDAKTDYWSKLKGMPAIDISAMGVRVAGLWQTSASTYLELL